MTVYKWSQNADTNSSVDATINWVEGQAPSTVNNSARAVMAAIAKMRDDISGKLVTSSGGTSTAYQLSSNQGFDTLAHMDGAMLSVKFDKTNGTPVTLNVDGLGAKALRVSPGVELATNVLVLTVPYGITYNNTDGAWYFQDGALAVSSQLGPSLIPVGGTCIWWTDTLPNANWLWCNGASVTQAAYPALALVFGVGVGGTIVLPDLRETVPLAKGGMGGTAGRGLLSFGGFNVLKTLFGAQTVAADLASHNHTAGVNNGAISISDTRTWGFGLTTTGDGQPGAGRVGWVSGGNTGVGVTGGSISGGMVDGTVTVNFNGSGGGHNNIQPSTVCNYIIRAI